MAKNNGMKVNADKCHLLVNFNEKVCAKTGSWDTQSSEQQNLLGVFIEDKLTFDKHINNLCVKIGQKLNASCPSSVIA